MKKMIVAFIVAFLVAAQGSCAQDSIISVEKSATSNACMGSNIDVTISLRNNMGETLDVTVEELLNGELVSPKENLIEQYEPLYRPAFLRWNLELEPYEEKELEYTIRMKRPGRLVIIPTDVYVGDQYIESNRMEIEISCLIDGNCETENGENYLNCPEDCTTGIEDGGCDLLEDGRCDPDCEEGFDPDCEKVIPEIPADYLLLVLVLAALIIAVIAAFIVYRRSGGGGGKQGRLQGALLFDI